MIILHGDNQVESRKALIELKEKAKDSEVVEINDTANLTEIIQALESSSLFGTDKLVIIENLFSSKKNKAQKEISDYLEKEDRNNLIIWESKELTEGTLKKFKAQIKVFKVSAEIFKLMDALNEKNTRQIIEIWETCQKQEAVELIFYMLVRQIRMLIQAKTSGVLKGHPFVVRKTEQQARNFSEEKLLTLHKKLYEIDKAQKTGTTPLSLEHEIEMWLREI